MAKFKDNESQLFLVLLQLFLNGKSDDTQRPHFEHIKLQCTKLAIMKYRLNCDIKEVQATALKKYRNYYSKNKQTFQREKRNPKR